MYQQGKKVLDLGSYRQFDIRDCLKEKFNTYVLDEGGVSSPLSISLVIPTKFEAKKLLEVEEETLHRILSQCSELVDIGYLDEIIIIGATRNRRGEPHFTILQNIVQIAYEELGLFKEQVDLLNKYKSQNQRAKRGLIDFFLKVVHQFDSNLGKLLAKYGVFTASGFFGILPGKGFGLWLTVPITQGDVVCFVDSDIINFKKEFITGLCHPIIYSWDVREAALQFVKAYYNRITMYKQAPLTPHLGGRVCRLLTIPLLQSIVKTLSLYPGIDTMKYPLAGEFAISKKVLETLHFPNTYAIETSILFQIYDLIGPSLMSQIDLELHQHIGQGFKNLENMSYQITDAIFRTVSEKSAKLLSIEEKTQIMNSFQRFAKIIRQQDKKNVSALKETIPHLDYSSTDAKEKIAVMTKIIGDVLSGKSERKRPRYFMTPSWEIVNERIGNYFALKEMFRRRANQSTWSRLYERKLVTG